VSRFDDRARQLLEEARTATKDLSGLSDEQRGGDIDALRRLEHAISYATLVIGATAGELFSESTFTALTNEFAQIRQDPIAAVANATNWADSLLDAVSRLPAARGGETAQAAREAAVDYQRSVEEHLQALRTEIDDVRARIGKVDTELGTSATNLEGRLNEIADTFRAKLAENDQVIANERSLLDSTKTTQAETFRQAQAERDEAFKTALGDATSELRKVLDESTTAAAGHMAEIERMEAESASLVGAIGLAGTAERYGEEVTQQGEAADFWRWCTVVLVGLAVVGIVVIVLTLGGDPQWEELVGKLSATLLFGGIATYTARQSARHRHREENARALQLELTAFGPFIEPLTEEQREEERVIMTRKTFGKASAALATPDEEPGPTALSAVLRRKEKG